MNIRIQKLTNDLIPHLENYLMQDPIYNAYLIHDLHKELDKSVFRIALRGNEIVGTLLVYLGLRYPVVWLIGEVEVVEKLLEDLKFDRALFNSLPEFADSIRRKFPSTKAYLMKLMVLGRGHECIIIHHKVERLLPKHAPELARLIAYQYGIELTEGLVEKVEETLKQPERYRYGIFQDGKLISVAGVSILFTGIGVLEGVFTHPEYRNKGLATSLVSKSVEEALKEVDRLFLYVRSDNLPAIRVYRKVGFREYREAVWIDLNTGTIP